MINVGEDDIINFIQCRIIYKFSLPGTITTNQGTMFTDDMVVASCKGLKWN